MAVQKREPGVGFFSLVEGGQEVLADVAGAMLAAARG
jgi:hypothetical protein